MQSHRQGRKNRARYLAIYQAFGVRQEKPASLAAAGNTQP
jgi:hypothetical protein